MSEKERLEEALTIDSAMRAIDSAMKSLTKEQKGAFLKELRARIMASIELIDEIDERQKAN